MRAVIGALELGDLRPAREGASDADRVHRRLGAGVREAQRLHGRDAARERLGQSDLVLGGAGVGHSERDGLVGRLHDVERRVTEDEARVVAVEVEAIDAIGVPEVGALRALDVERIGVEERRRPTVPTWHDGAGFFVK